MKLPAPAPVFNGVTGKTPRSYRASSLEAMSNSHYNKRIRSTTKCDWRRPWALWFRSSAVRAWRRRTGDGGGAQGDPREAGGQSGHRRRHGAGRHDRRPDRDGRRDHRQPAGPRDGHAPGDRRADLHRPHGDGDPGARREGDQLHRRADRHRHRQHAHQGPHQDDRHAPASRGARRREHRHRRRLSGRRRTRRHHDARPRRLRHDRRRPGGRHEAGRLTK